MTAALLQARLQALRAVDGLLGCALVDLETGMVVQSAGSADLPALAEAASDYWRLCRRQRLFASLGPLRAQAVIHEHTRVTIVRCGEGLLLVTLSQEGRGIDWDRWKAGVQALQQLASGL